MRRFHNEFRSYGHRIDHVHADNHPFDSDEFNEYVKVELRASKTHSGVGAKHMNGVAERAIGTISNWSRTLMLHAITHWPESADLSLWPFAMEHAVYLWNNLPKQTTKLAPIELFTGTRFHSYEHLQRAHVWGAPAYVLDPALQDGRSIPRWQARSRRGQFMGLSPQHSSSVACILHQQTGHVSPQFHVVFDDLFSTVVAGTGGPFDTERFDAASWSKLVSTGLERYLEQELDDDGKMLPLPPLQTEWTDSAEGDDAMPLPLQREPTRQFRVEFSHPKPPCSRPSG